MQIGVAARMLRRAVGVTFERVRDHARTAP
jgi:hypothetical protein